MGDVVVVGADVEEGSYEVEYQKGEEDGQEVD